MFLPHGRARLAAERGRGAQRRPDHPRRRRAGGGVPGLPAGRADGPSTGGRRHRSRIRDRRGAHPPAHGPRRRAARRRAEGTGCGRTCGSTWRPPRPSSGRRPTSPTPTCLRRCRTRFGRSPRSSWTNTAARCGRSRRSTRWRPECSSARTGGHTPGHSIVRLASGGDALTFAGDAVFAARVRQPRVAQRLRTRPRGGGPRPDPSPAGAGSDRRVDWWPPTCRSRPSAGWRPPATSSGAYRPPGITESPPGQRLV